MPTILTSNAPTVTLSRIQSGIGSLVFEARCADAPDDLRMGCAYQLRSGQSSIIEAGGRTTTMPPPSSRPIITGAQGPVARLTVDLLQSPDIERLVIYAYPDGGVSRHWGGTLTTTAFGPARIEIPLDRPPTAGVIVLLSLYNIAGEFVVRAEMEDVPGSVRDACTAYGFDRISWLDAHTALA